MRLELDLAEGNWSVIAIGTSTTQAKPEATFHLALGTVRDAFEWGQLPSQIHVKLFDVQVKKGGATAKMKVRGACVAPKTDCVSGVVDLSVVAFPR